MTTNKILIYIIVPLFTLAASGCFTFRNTVNSGGKVPLYLQISNPDNYTYYVNDKEVPWSYVVYSADQTSGKGGYTTVTSLPALSISAEKAYIVLKIVNKGTNAQRQYILKSDLMVGSKLVMYFQGMFTMGIGNAIDFSTHSIFAWPEQDIKF